MRANRPRSTAAHEAITRRRHPASRNSSRVCRRYHPSMARCIILGAGPAGLAAACAFGESAVVIESGPSVALRRREDPSECVEGVGGAGLFSDGKFSYWPSATQVWRLDPKYLEAAISWLSHQLSSAEIPETLSTRREPAQLVEGAFTQKSYPSFYASLSQRRRLIDFLLDGIDVVTGTEVVGLSLSLKGPANIVAQLSNGREIRANRLIIATGRFGSLQLSEGNLGKFLSPMRLEFGVRLEQPARDFFLRQDGRLDPKLILRESGYECRTFCCCRNGEVIKTITRGITSVSGRADGARTDRSNVGFMCRTTDRTVLAHATHLLIDCVRSQSLPMVEELGAFLSGQPSLGLPPFGQHLTARLSEGLRRLQSHYPALTDSGTTVHLPALEGVGWYPQTDEDLCVVPGHVWAAGDVVGRFRGIVAALISGYVAGTAAKEA